jgi:AcrR family transcriptional regulator
MIARAASEIGLDNVTMKAVAEHLGVSVPGLYHHVDGRDDLMRLATAYSAQRIVLPGDRGQHWTEWLLEWSRHAFEVFVAQPEMLNQVQRGVHHRPHGRPRRRDREAHGAGFTGWRRSRPST